MKRDARPRAGQSPNEDWIWTEAGLQCADVAGHCRLVWGVRWRDTHRCIM